MLYYPYVDSKTNEFCIQTAQEIHDLLTRLRGDHPRTAFSAPELADAGIHIPKTSYRLLRNRGWFERLNTRPSSAPINWRLTQSAIRWLEENRRGR